MIELGGVLHREGFTTTEQVENLLTGSTSSPKIELQDSTVLQEIIERYKPEKGYLQIDLEFNRRLYEFAKGQLK